MQPQSFNPAQETLCELKISHCDESQHLSSSSPPERHPGLGFRTKWMSPNMKSTLKLMPSQLEQHLWSISLQVSAQENTNQLNDGAFTSLSVHINFKTRNPPWTKLPIKWIKYTERYPFRFKFKTGIKHITDTVKTSKGIQRMTKNQ